MKIKTTVRRAVGAAPPGMTVGISDYSQQEVRAISCIAQIKRFIDAYFDAEVHRPILKREDTGEEYSNPDADTHILSARGLYPELESIAQTRPWDLDRESRLDMGGWNRRDRGKVCSFTVIYGGSASRISTALQIEKEQAEGLLKNYFEMFPELQAYINRISTLAKYQKWVECPVTNRRYFINESNSKGLDDENTTSRRACNCLIQGISSVMTKKASWNVMHLFDELNNKYSADIPEGKHSRLVGVIHDEIVSYIPGTGTITGELDKKGNIVKEYSELTLEFARAQEMGMKKAMDELLHPLVPGFPSKAECGLGSSWASK
jgi:hypothetical protein